jgi:hypothetical protein
MTQSGHLDASHSPPPPPPVCVCLHACVCVYREHRRPSPSVLEEMDPFTLAATLSLVLDLKSVITALALVFRHVTVEEACQASALEEAHNQVCVCACVCVHTGMPVCVCIRECMGKGPKPVAFSIH